MRCLFLIAFLGLLPFVVHGQKPKFVHNEVLVKFVTGVKAESKAAAHGRLQARHLETLGDLGWQRVRLPKGFSVEAAIKRYRALDDVIEAQPNFYYSLLATPNDPQFTATGMYGLTKISAPLAWDITTGSPSVVVANIDTGIRYTHEDLAANMWVNPSEIPGNGIDDDGNGFVDDIYGYDFRFNDPDPMDENGHGTHTAGTIGAVGNNSLGVVGVNWNVKLMAVKIFSAAGTDTTSAMIINAYNYVRMMKNRGVNIRVSSNSYGGCSVSCGVDVATKEAIDALGDADILNVFAAGNAAINGTLDNDVEPFPPASYPSPSILAVAASDSLDGRRFRYGVKSVDLAAPGVVILSTGGGSDTHYTHMSGTSMATPHVAGAAALLAARDPSLSAISLKASLLNNVDILPAWDGFVRTGGRLNVARAFEIPTQCTFSTDAAGILAPTKGGVYTVELNAPANCDYEVRPDVNWIHVLGQRERTGSSSVAFRVKFNTTIRRSGSLRIGDKTIQIVQSRDNIF